MEIPLDGGVILRAREPWPSSSRVYCHPWEGPWPEGAEVLEDGDTTLTVVIDEGAEVVVTIWVE